MAEFTGRMFSDLGPNGWVRIVFVAGDCTAEPAFAVKNLAGTQKGFHFGSES